MYEDLDLNEIYTFSNETGKLMYIDSSLDNSSISVEYNGQLPSLFRHTTGRSMNVTYTDGGMIRAVDLLDENGNVERTR